MTKTFIVIHINSDLDPVALPTNTDDEVVAARAALRLAGLAWEDVRIGEPDSLSGHLNGTKLYAEVADDDDDGPCLCSHCNGSGEGRYDGSTCQACRGSGEVRDLEAERDREADRADYLYDQMKDDRMMAQYEDSRLDDGFIDDDLPF